MLNSPEEYRKYFEKYNLYPVIDSYFMLSIVAEILPSLIEESEQGT